VSPAATAPPPPAPAIPYGQHPNQVANLHLPAGPSPFPVVVLLHGGFWRVGWDRTLMTALARDLAERGIAAWNVEYRRVGEDGGGWPGTFLDVAAAVDHLAGVEGVDRERVVTCGHSAGGHLALWLAGRHKLSRSDPGSVPTVRPRGAVALAPVAAFSAAWESGFAREQLLALLGGAPDAVPDRYRCADPARLAPLGVPAVLVHGGADDVVPSEQSRAFVGAAAGEAELVELANADHFDVIEPRHAAWQAVLERLPRLFEGSFRAARFP
jgi:acetyl esterase/lipase